MIRKLSVKYTFLQLEDRKQGLCTHDRYPWRDRKKREDKFRRRNSSGGNKRRRPKLLTFLIHMPERRLLTRGVDNV